MLTLLKWVVAAIAMAVGFWLSVALMLLLLYPGVWLSRKTGGIADWFGAGPLTWVLVVEVVWICAAGCTVSVLVEVGNELRGRYWPPKPAYAKESEAEGLGEPEVDGEEVAVEEKPGKPMVSAQPWPSKWWEEKE